jgi:hypothetical protein
LQPTMNPNIHKMCMTPHPSSLSPRVAPVLFAQARGGQGEGQVSLEMTSHDITEKLVSSCGYRWTVHVVHAFYATIG